MTVLDHARYRDQVLGLWLGKFIGGTAGAPIEGLRGVHRLGPDQVLPRALAENDDTDLQLLWLHALEEHGPGLDAGHLAREWMEHVDAPWCEYGVAAHNLAQGIPPPESGRHDNWFFGENMGCPIRSEIWGAICPGRPDLAARYAGMDAAIDHFGIAVDAERFLAAIEAALFTETDLGRLLDIGLAYCAPGGRFAGMVHDVRRWHLDLPWRTVRERILQDHGDPCSLHALPNLGFIVLGLLEGRGDFAATIAAALNCGWDSDCTAASAGAIIGGLLGASAIPARFRAAVPDTYAISAWMLGFPRAGSLAALTDATCAMGVRVARTLAAGTVFAGLPAGPDPDRLAVAPQPGRLAPPIPRTQATWRIVGPFWSAWDERRQAEGDHGTGAAAPPLPSMAYMTHLGCALARDDLDPAQVLDPDADLGTAQVWTRSGEDSRLPLAGLPRADMPCSLYAGTTVTCAAAHPAWLMIGSSGPLRVWLNGHELLHSGSYQPLTPTTFPLHVHLAAGENRLVLKLARTSQPFAACVAIKDDRGAHWHQCFHDRDVRWA